MLYINEEILRKVGLTFEEFSWIWVALMIAGAIIAGLGIFRKKKDWMNEAQERQNAKYEYSDPVLESSTPRGRLTPEEKELAKQIKIDHSQPSFEEWKAAREREQGKGE